MILGVTSTLLCVLRNFMALLPKYLVIGPVSFNLPSPIILVLLYYLTWTQLARWESFTCLTHYKPSRLFRFCIVCYVIKIIVLNCMTHLNVFIIYLVHYKPLWLARFFYPVFICNVCFNLDWTINYLSTTTTLSIVQQLFAVFVRCILDLDGNIHKPNYDLYKHVIHVIVCPTLDLLSPLSEGFAHWQW